MVNLLLKSINVCYNKYIIKFLKISPNKLNRYINVLFFNIGGIYVRSKPNDVSRVKSISKTK